ncbi:hypothetical protein [Falsiphaeobacter marinintestinus]|uniref:hypothetical protein n=1 Tax=Falsiphaeobacter marinintestinus TaxID=1492905 RepID=UPI0011B54A00|nr:hypothetical protein [Phaeobacter marinintestinus]
MLPLFIDLYCERTGPGFWGEPVNALSNLTFAAAALIAARSLSRRGGADRGEVVLVVLAGVIGSMPPGRSVKAAPS